MAPTRELAQQIEDETVKFAHFLVCLQVLFATSYSLRISKWKLI